MIYSENIVKDIHNRRRKIMQGGKLQRNRK
uniref:Uncharacterized protein n=1 Tax=Siphoviridae sp. ct1SN28 TaxID=2825308 RepID=A0A8S5TRL9_9CAUD|nr:MAG TPA: hypothetical protein [Siphoviridae sp. ct1SN28]